MSSEDGRHSTGNGGVRSQLEAESDKEKRWDIIEAAKKNDVDTLRRLLDSPRWYEVKDIPNNSNILHISIHHNRKEVFDYLLSISDFPLEMLDRHGLTPLSVAIIARDSGYFALELIKKGANVFHIQQCYKRSTLYLAALEQNILAAQLLIEKGVDLDSQDYEGETALHSALLHRQSEIDIVSLLLYHGANPRIRSNLGCLPFEKLVDRQSNDGLHWSPQVIFDTLFYYTFDRLSVTEMDVGILLKLAKFESPLVDEIHHVYANHECYSTNYGDLFAIDVKYLKMFAHKFTDTFQEILPMCFSQGWPKAATIEKLDVLLDSSLRDDVISCIQDLKDDCLFSTFIYRCIEESQITDTYCYLLSYGLNITEIGLKRIYNRFGYCELFEILLHMDIQMQLGTVQPIIPSIFYDVTKDAESYVENSSRYLSKDLLLMLYYFSSWELLPDVVHMTRVNTNYLEEKTLNSRIIILSSPPLLVQLARDVFRKYFIRRLKIKNSRQFYTNLRSLQIGEIYKRIISFQKKLYE